MGSPVFSVATLEALMAAGHEIAAVYCQPPKPAGRGQQETPCPVHQRALALGLEVRTPKSLKTPEAQAEFAALNLDVAVVVAYGLILPQAILDAPKMGCINIHASLLPRWRGAAPIHRAIQAGDDKTGICIMQMEAGLDTGPVWAHEAVAITETMTTAELHDILSAMGARMIAPTLAKIAAGEVVAEAQPEIGVTYAAKLSKEEGFLDTTRPVAELARQVRAFTPWPACWIEYHGERVKVFAASIVPMASAGDFILECADGWLRLDRVQRANRAAMDGSAFLRGFSR